LTNNLDLSDSSDEDPDPNDLPMKQFDKYPKNECVIALVHPTPSYPIP